MADPALAWLDALIARHMSSMTRPEFLKAVRALSARYVERRAELPDRSALDSAGKRAAFAGFYAPIHFFTVREVVRALGGDRVEVRSILDLGCGTGVAAAAWAMALKSPPPISGIDLNSWALEEARWNWQTLALGGRARRGDLVAELEAHARDKASPPAVVLGWSLNELAPDRRLRALELIPVLARRGAPVLVIEPIATRLVPWWPSLAERTRSSGGRADEWKFDTNLPSPLSDLDDAAGFSREGLSARSVSFNLR